jgi:serine protease Do
MTIAATLGETPTSATNERAEMQNRLGGQLSQRRAGFPSVLQHDTVLRPNECGGPLVDLDGRAVAVNIARAGRVASYAVPASVAISIVEELKTGKFKPDHLANDALTTTPTAVAMP